MLIVKKLSKVAHFTHVKSTYQTTKVADILMRKIFKLHGMPSVIILDASNKI